MYAVIRNERVAETKSALEAVGIKGVTFLHVTGKGEKDVIGTPISSSFRRNFDLALNRQKETGERNAGPAGSGGRTEEESAIEPDFIPRRMLILVVSDDEVSPIVEAIISANKTGRHGDGKIFICPMISAIRVRTGEQGDRALE